MAWYNPNWKRRRAITVKTDNLDADILNDRLYVKITNDVDLADNANVEGRDIVFATEDGTLIYFQLIRYNVQVSPHVANGEWWLQTNLYALGTTIYMYYSNVESLPMPPVVANNDWPENFCTFHGGDWSYYFNNISVFFNQTTYHCNDFTISSFFNYPGAAGPDHLLCGFMSSLQYYNTNGIVKSWKRPYELKNVLQPDEHGVWSIGSVKVYNQNGALWPVISTIINNGLHQAALTYNALLNGTTDVLTLYIDGELVISQPGAGMAVVEYFYSLANPEWSPLYRWVPNGLSVGFETWVDEVYLSNGGKEYHEIKFEYHNIADADHAIEIGNVVIGPFEFSYEPSGALYVLGSAHCMSSYYKAETSGEIQLDGVANVKLNVKYVPNFGWMPVCGSAKILRVFRFITDGKLPTSITGQASFYVTFNINLTTTWDVLGYVENSLSTYWNVSIKLEEKWIRVPNITLPVLKIFDTSRNKNSVAPLGTPIIKTSGSNSVSGSSALTSTMLNPNEHWEYLKSIPYLNWYRVQGECLPNGCASIGFDAGDKQCNTGNIQYTQLLAANNLEELAALLKNKFLTQPLLHWKIKSIKQYSEAVYSNGIAAPSNDCLKWTELNWKSVPQLSDFNLVSDGGISENNEGENDGVSSVNSSNSGSAGSVNNRIGGMGNAGHAGLDPCSNRGLDWKPSLNGGYCTYTWQAPNGKTLERRVLFSDLASGKISVPSDALFEDGTLVCCYLKDHFKDNRTCSVFGAGSAAFSQGDVYYPGWQPKINFGGVLIRRPDGSVISCRLADLIGGQVQVPSASVFKESGFSVCCYLRDQWHDKRKCGNCVT
jgi:hypothetical protein